MSQQRHQRLQDLFLGAVELPLAERGAFLDRACDGDVELQREVDALLAADGDAGDDSPDSSPAPAAMAELVSAASGYRVLGELGRGGMGVVYLGERADGAFQRRVAVKVMQRWAGAGGVGEDGELLRRFRAEREILAALDHPNIARLLDGGSLPDGTPFLVMEHVDGLPIDRFAQSRALDVEARLELFVAVCGAVQAAHQALVVHRDLKPSNVLVTAEGTPKLLDFGIAKLLDPRAVEWTALETRLGVQPLTPRWASPEQLTGGAITTATDVYALGVLLYELLTERSPYCPRTSAVHHWVEAVCEQEPRLPSTAVLRDDETLRTAPPEAARAPASDRAALGRRLRGDLDHILLRALRKEPRERYATAAELAADVRRHLEGLPIVARPATLRYRAGRFARRHRVGVAVTVAMASIVGAFTVGLVRQLRRTEEARDRAQAVTALLLEVFDVAGPSTAERGEPTASEVLERGLERLEGRLAGQPQVKASLLVALGRVYNNLGRLPEAARAHEQALALRAAARRQAPLEYAESLGQVALGRLARNELTQAEAMYREALAITEREAGAHDLRAVALRDGLVQVLARAGRHLEAADLAAEVVQRTAERLGYPDAAAALDGGSSSPELVALATTLGTLATEQRQLGRYAAAAASFDQALALNRRLLGERHYGVAFNLNNLANVESNLGRHTRALAVRAEALAIAEPALGIEHPSVASMRLNQGFDLVRVGRFEEALGAIAAARDALVAGLGESHPAVAIANGFEALARSGQGQGEEALRLAAAALERLRSVLGEEHPEVAAAHATLAEVLHANGRPAEAAAGYSAAATLYERAVGSDHPDTLGCRSRAAEALLAAGDAEAARGLLAPVVGALAARDDLPLRLAEARFRLARALAVGGLEDAAARREAAAALSIYRDEGQAEAAAVVESWLDGSG